MYSYQETISVSSDKSQVIAASKHACLSVGCLIRKEEHSTLIARERINWLWVDPVKLVIDFREDGDNCELSIFASSWWWGSKRHKRWIVQEFSKALELKLSGKSSTSVGEEGAVRTISKFNDPTLLQFDIRIPDLIKDLNEEETREFNSKYKKRKKSVLGGVLLALFLGGFGAHRFWLGEIKAGFLYLIFCWTYIPSFIGWIEACRMGKTVSKKNYKTALEIMEKIKSSKQNEVG